MKYLILGAGPAGLAFGNKLKEMGENSFLILEKEEEVGGLCRSKKVDKAPFDMGGGHFLDVRDKEVNQFLFQFMQENEWNLFERDSRINLNGKLISHPIEANIWQMDLETQVEYLKSIVAAGCNCNIREPKKFTEWIYWKLGTKIAEEYMVPYNKKMFGEELDELGIYWLDKLPSVSFDETLLSCLSHKAYGKQPGHASFYYPKKYGYGEVWRRMGENINTHIECCANIVKIDLNNHKVWTKDNCEFSAENIIVTIPWSEFEVIKGISTKMFAEIGKLKYTSIATTYVDETLNTEAQWIYFPDKELKYHRILLRSNFCENSKGYWTESRVSASEYMLEKESFLNKYAYPLNTIDKPLIIAQLLKTVSEFNVYGLGRWGEWEHFNSDVTVKRAINLAQILCSSRKV